MLFELTGGQGVDSPLLLREVSTVHNLIPRIYPNYHPTFHKNYTPETGQGITLYIVLDSVDPTSLLKGFLKNIHSITIFFI